MAPGRVKNLQCKLNRAKKKYYIDLFVRVFAIILAKSFSSVRDRFI